MEETPFDLPPGTPAHPGERLKLARTDAGLSRAELAGRRGVAASTVAAHENGQNNIGPAVAEQYALILGVSPQYILYGVKGSARRRNLETTPSRVSLVPLVGTISEDWERIPRGTNHIAAAVGEEKAILFTEEWYVKEDCPRVPILDEGRLRPELGLQAFDVRIISERAPIGSLALVMPLPMSSPERDDLVVYVRREGNFINFRLAVATDLISSFGLTLKDVSDESAQEPFVLSEGENGLLTAEGPDGRIQLVGVVEALTWFRFPPKEWRRPRRG